MQDEEDPLRYARLLKPYPTKRLAKDLAKVKEYSSAVDRKLTELLISPPTLPREWRHELASLDEMLFLLGEQCELTHPGLIEMWEAAEADYERSVTAMVGILRGLAQAPRDEVVVG